MKNLLKKVRGDKKGFTLAELLVVVAIVGILVAISVPLFTAQLGKARQATNNANLRAAKIAAVAEYLTENSGDHVSECKYQYDISSGSISTSTVTLKDDDKISINGESVSKTTVYKNIYVTVKGTDTKDAVVQLYAN